MFSAHINLNTSLINLCLIRRLRAKLVRHNCNRRQLMRQKIATYHGIALIDNAAIIELGLGCDMRQSVVGYKGHAITVCKLFTWWTGGGYAISGQLLIFEVQVLKIHTENSGAQSGSWLFISTGGLRGARLVLMTLKENIENLLPQRLITCSF